MHGDLAIKTKDLPWKGVNYTSLCDWLTATVIPKFTSSQVIKVLVGEYNEQLYLGLFSRLKKQNKKTTCIFPQGKKEKPPSHPTRVMPKSYNHMIIISFFHTCHFSFKNNQVHPAFSIVAINHVPPLLRAMSTSKTATTANLCVSYDRQHTKIKWNESK